MTGSLYEAAECHPVGMMLCSGGAGTDATVDEAVVWYCAVHLELGTLLVYW